MHLMFVVKLVTFSVLGKMYEQSFRIQSKHFKIVIKIIVVNSNVSSFRQLAFKKMRYFRCNKNVNFYLTEKIIFAYDDAV